MSDKFDWDLLYPENKESPAHWRIGVISPIEWAYVCPCCGKNGAS